MTPKPSLVFVASVFFTLAVLQTIPSSTGRSWNWSVPGGLAAFAAAALWLRPPAETQAAS